jgi:23S rRNA (cytosine1962-C5)-methyltransferase
VGPIVRRGTLRLPHEVARRVRAGHPWVFRETAGRILKEKPGDPVELVDWDGEFVGRGICDGEGVIAVRVMTRDPSETIGTQLVGRRVASAVALRRRCLDFARQQAIRLIHGESDGLPAISVDRYGDYLVAQFFSSAMLRYRDTLFDALEREVKPAAIYEQRRFRSLGGEAPKGPAELARGQAAPVEIEVAEGELRFVVDVTAPLSTGLFADLRLGRASVARWARDRRVLNLFSYTGALSVYATHGGAAQVVAVDVSAKAHARARRNFAVNQLDAEKPEHIVGDVFGVLAKMADRKREFDMVVLDPPAFGTGGKGRSFSATRDYAELVAASLRVVAPGGVMVAVSGTRKLLLPDYETAIGEGALAAGVPLRIVERQGLPPDFPQLPGFAEANYLKFSVALRD